MEWRVGRNLLIFSLVPRSAPFFLHDGRAPGKPDPSADINVLRKYMENARWQGIRKPFDERIITIELVKLQIWGEETTIRFLVHAGRVPTAWYLLDGDNRILWSRNDKQAVAGTRFHPEPDERLPLKELTPNTIRAATSPRDLYGRYRGLGPAWSRELMVSENPEALLAMLKAAVPSGGYRYPKDDFPVPMTSLGNPEAQFESLSEAVARRLIQDVAEQRFQQRKRTLLKQLNRQLDRKQSLVAVLEQELRDCARADRILKQAELLSAHFTQLKRGMSSITLTDLETGNPITVSLDPDTSPQAWISRLYRKAARLKRKKPLLQKRIRVVRAELAALADERYAVEMATVAEDLLQPEQPDPKRRKSNRKDPETGILRIDLRDGFFLYVGRNSKGNQTLYSRKLGPDDLWFHAKDIPGSHVVLKNPGGKSVPEDLVELAARIAAWFSRDRRNSRVEVQFTDKKNLYSSKGKGSGFVLLRHFRTLHVTPLNPETL